MRKEFLEAGKIVGTHGVRGTVRIDAWSDNPQFLAGFKRFYLEDKKTTLEVLNIAPHGRVVIADFKGVGSIEDAEKLRNKIIYIKRDDAKLPEDKYFIDEIIGSEAFNADSGELLGILCDVSKTGANDVWHIKSGEKEYLLPAVDEVIVSVDIDASKVILRPLKGIFEDED